MNAYASEREALKPLPEDRFQVPIWKHVTVHASDQFVTFNTMRFSLPEKWRGEQVWARYTHPFVDFSYDEQHIRRYVVAAGGTCYWHREDFPEGTREMMDGGYPAWITGESQRFGEEASALVRAVLHPQAYLNARRARGMLPLFEEYHTKPYFDEVCRRARGHRVRLPETLKHMFEGEEQKRRFLEPVAVSSLGVEMIRDIRYYLN